MALKDQTLVRQTLAGQSEAFGVLVDRYSGLVYSLILELVRRPEDVQDLVQEVFCKAYQCLSSLHRPASFPSWLAQIAYTTTLSWLRREKSRNRVEVFSQRWTLPEPPALPDREVELTERSGLLWRLLDQLPAEQRRLVVLYYLEGGTYRQIARFLGKSVATVRWQLLQAERRLGQELGRMLGEERGIGRGERQCLREKVMACLPMVVLFRPRPFTAWRAWGLGSLLGAAGLVYFQPWADEPPSLSREALRAEQQAKLLSEPVMEWIPLKPRAGQRMRIAAADLQVQEGKQAELHYIADIAYPIDRAVPMRREGRAWAADLEVPEKAVALSFYIAPRREGPQDLRSTAYLTIQKLLKRYQYALLVCDEAGVPVRGAAQAQALLAQRQARDPEEVLAWADRELSLYPDHFRAYAMRWNALEKIGNSSAAVLAQIRAEQESLKARYPDQPELLWWTALASGDWQQGFQELYQRFPGYERADEAAYRRTINAYRGDPPRLLAALEEFRARFPQSRYTSEVYRDYLNALVQIAPEQAAQLADSLIHHQLVLPQEAQQGYASTLGGFLLEGYAYSLRFELLLQEKKRAEALSLASRLIASGLQDPLPYLYLGQKLAGQKSPSLLCEAPPDYPRDQSLALEILEAGLPWASPEHLLQLPGHPYDPSLSDSARAAQRQTYLDQAYAQRQALLQALARGYLETGETARAVHCLEEFAGLRAQIKRYFMEDDRTSFLLGKGYEGLNKWKAAEQAYLQAVAQDYSHPEAEAALRRMHLGRYGHLEALQVLL